MRVFVASLLCLAYYGAVYAQQPKSYPLHCRAGVSLWPSIENNVYGVSGPVLVGTFQHVDQARTPRPGSCTWDDRPLGKTEPHRFCLAVTTPDLRRNGAARLIGALGSTDGATTLMVYNNGGSCMVVTGIVRTDFGNAQPRSGSVTIEDIRAGLPARRKPTPGGGGKGDGKADNAANPASLPRPPRGDEVGNRVRSHGNALLAIVRGLVDAPTLTQYLSEERGRCGDESFCLMELRRTAIAIAVEGR